MQNGLRLAPNVKEFVQLSQASVNYCEKLCNLTRLFFSAGLSMAYTTQLYSNLEIMRKHINYNKHTNLIYCATGKTCEGPETVNKKHWKQNVEALSSIVAVIYAA